jgi:hypothetical protein
MKLQYYAARGLDNYNTLHNNITNKQNNPYTSKQR